LFSERLKKKNSELGAVSSASAATPFFCMQTVKISLSYLLIINMKIKYISFSLIILSIINFMYVIFLKKSTGDVRYIGTPIGEILAREQMLEQAANANMAMEDFSSSEAPAGIYKF